MAVSLRQNQMRAEDPRPRDVAADPGERPGLARKTTLYFPEQAAVEIEAEAARQGHSFAWVVRAAWRASKARIAGFPSAPVVLP